MTLLFANNAQSRLAGSISNVATTAVLSAGTGALFPNPTPGNSFRLTFTDAATGENHEIVDVTARSGDTITMTRAQEGTAASAWLAGDFAENLCTAGSMAVFLQSGALVAIANNEVLGNISGGAAIPIGLTQAQFTALINSFTTTLSGAAPASGGGTTNFLRADGTWAPPPTTLPSGSGQCRLQYNSPTQLALLPYNGNLLSINGVPQAVPGAGVLLSNSGLAAATFYYIYAFMVSTTVTLEASVTVPVTGTNGVKQKTGDATRSLVGACYTDAGTPGTFALTGTKLWVLSWYNRRLITGKNIFSTNRSTGSGTFVELNTEIRIQFISWLDDLIRYYIDGQCTNTISVNGVLTGVGFDGALVEEGAGGDPAAANIYISAALSGTFDQAGWTENTLHYSTVLGEVTAGSGLWLALSGNNAGIVLGTTINA